MWETAWTHQLSRLRHVIDQLGDEPEEWTWEEFRFWAQKMERLANTTIDQRIRQLRFMAGHDVFPVQIESSRTDLVKSFFLYVHYREEEEGCNYGALHNDHKAIRTLGKFLMIPKAVWPKMPSPPKDKTRWIPSPSEVYDLIHADFTPNPVHNYENHLTKALLLWCFGYGVRMPSEGHVAQLADVDLAAGTVIIREPKKRDGNGPPPVRRLYVEPEWMLTAPTRPSIANYLKWRDKVDPNREQDALFLRANGTPFPSPGSIRMFLNRKVEASGIEWADKFHPYLGRHWCANARLIEWSHDYGRVADWLGHESVEMLRSEYEHDARILEKVHGRNWIARMALRNASRD